MLALIYLIAAALIIPKLTPGKEGSPKRLNSIIFILAFFHSLRMIYLHLSLNQITPKLMVESIGFQLILILALTLKKNTLPKHALFIFPFALLIFITHSVGLQFNTFSFDQGILSDNQLQHAQQIALHIFLALLGYCSIFVLMVSAIMILWQTRLLKSHRSSPASSFIPDLLHLDSIQFRSILIGLPAFTFAIGLGKLGRILWELKVEWSAQIIMTLVIWSIFVLLFIARFIPKIRKPFLAYGSLIGFSLAFISFAFIKDTHHTFLGF